MSQSHETENKLRNLSACELSVKRHILADVFKFCLFSVEKYLTINYSLLSLCQFTSEKSCSRWCSWKDRCTVEGTKSWFELCSDHKFSHVVDVSCPFKPLLNSVLEDCLIVSFYWSFSFLLRVVHILLGMISWVLMMKTIDLSSMKSLLVSTVCIRVKWPKIGRSLPLFL